MHDAGRQARVDMIATEKRLLMKGLEGSAGLHGTSLQAVSALMRTGMLPSDSSKEGRNNGRIYFTLTDTNRRAILELKRRLPGTASELPGYFNSFYSAFNDVKVYAGFDHFYREAARLLASTGMDPCLVSKAALWYTVKRVVKDSGAEGPDRSERAFPEWLPGNERKKLLPIMTYLSGIRYKNRGFVIGFNEDILDLGILPDPDTGRSVYVRCPLGIPLRMVSGISPLSGTDASEALSLLRRL